MPEQLKQGPESQDKLVYIEADGPSTNKTVAPVFKTFGPLSVSNIGLSVGGSSLSTISVSVDAALALDPISMSLLGFAFTIDLFKVTSLGELSSMAFKPSIKGMSVEFNKPPTRLAGLFLTFDDNNESGFLGVIASLRLWVYNVTVAFGPDKSAPPPLEWRPFVRLVKNLPVEVPKNAVVSDEARVPDHILSLTKGTVPVDKNEKQQQQQQKLNSSELSGIADIRGT